MSLFDAVYESLAKAIAYADDRPDAQNQVNGFLAATGYKIDRVFDDPQTSFHAIGLVSLTPDKPPVLVFRGTDSTADDAANADRRSIGFNQFEANKSAIGNWLTQISQDTAKNPKKLLPDVTGHSLGGALTQLAATEFTERIGDVVTFNSPGVSQAIVNTFTQKGGAAKNVVHYIVNGDFISLGGEGFLPGKAFLQSYTDPNINPLIVLAKHTQKNLLTNSPVGFSQQEISIEQLSRASFAYNDSDYSEFIYAMKSALPQYSDAVSTRAGVEATRTKDGFSFLGLIGTISAALDPAQNNRLVGDNQNNKAIALGGNDTIIGNGGSDLLYGNQGDDIVSGGANNDTLYGGKNNDVLYGNQEDDVLIGNFGKDSLYGGKNNDVLYGNQEDDVLIGNFGKDSLYGGKNNDVLYGNQEDDVLIGNFGKDSLYGGKNNDVLYGNQEDDVLIGNFGKDSLYGGKNNDVLYGNQEDDVLIGDLGSDTLYGGKNNDVLIGGDGDDFLYGDLGTDSLTGGNGNDRFVLVVGGGTDTIADFQDGKDRLALAGGLTFDRLTITSGSNGTTIGIASSGEILALLNGVQVGAIASNDFTLL